MSALEAVRQRLARTPALFWLALVLGLLLAAVTGSWRSDALRSHAQALALAEQWRALNVAAMPRADTAAGPNPADPLAVRLAYYLDQTGQKAELENLDGQTGATLNDLDADAAVNLVSRLQAGLGASLKQAELLMNESTGRWSVFVLVGDTR